MRRRRAEGLQQASPSWVLAALGTRVSQSSAMLTLADGAVCSIKALGSGSTPRGWSCCRGETCPQGSQLLLCPTLTDWYHSTPPHMRPEPPLFFAHPSPRLGLCSTITKATFLSWALPWQAGGLRLRSIIAGTRLPVPWASPLSQIEALEPPLPGGYPSGFRSGLWPIKTGTRLPLPWTSQARLRLWAVAARALLPPPVPSSPESQYIALTNNHWWCTTAILWVLCMVGRGGGRLETLTYHSKAALLLHPAFWAQATRAPCHPRALVTALSTPLLTSHSRERVKPKYQFHKLYAHVDTLDTCAMPAATVPKLQGPGTVVVPRVPGPMTPVPI